MEETKLVKHWKYLRMLRAAKILPGITVEIVAKEGEHYLTEHGHIGIVAKEYKLVNVTSQSDLKPFWDLVNK